MTIKDMVACIEGEVLLGENELLEREVTSAFCSDLMSDVLAFVNESTVLITGLINPHVIRTSEMLDLKCIIFVRGKIPPPEVLSAAEELGICVLSSRHTAFTTCGLLYTSGLRGIQIQRDSEGRL